MDCLSKSHCLCVGCIKLGLYLHMVDILFGSHLPTYEYALVHIELLDKWVDSLLHIIKRKNTKQVGVKSHMPGKSHEQCMHKVDVGIPYISLRPLVAAACSTPVWGEASLWVHGVFVEHPAYFKVASENRTAWASLCFDTLNKQRFLQFKFPFPFTMLEISSFKGSMAQCTLMNTICMSFTKFVNHFFLMYWFKSLFGTLSYVKENITVYSYVRLMIKWLSMCLHPRAPMLCIWSQIFNSINHSKTMWPIL